MLLRTLKAMCSNTSKASQYLIKYTQKQQVIGSQNSQIQQLKKQLKQLEQENKAKNDKIHQMRKKLTNDIQKGQQIWELAKKKTYKNKMESIKHFSKNLLELGEYFKAIKQVQKQEHSAQIKQGFEMTSRMFFNTLEKYKIIQFQPKEGDKFDKKKMIVTGEQKGDKSKTGLVAKNIEKGWMVEEEIIKQAKVVVYS